MSGKRIVMWQVPKERWQGAADRETVISSFVRDALDIELRLPKGVNLANERMRYQLCCRRIQNAILQDQLATTNEVVDEEIFSMLRDMARNAQSAFTNNRLAACFFPPELMEKAIIAMASYLDQFHKNSNETGVRAIKKRLQFFETSFAKKSGIVETLDFLAEKTMSPALIELGKVSSRLTSLQGIVMEADEGLSSGNSSIVYQNLLASVEQAIRSGGTVNFSNQPHTVVTEVLNTIAYAAKGQSPAIVRVVYMDGTEAEPFPVRCLQRTAEEVMDGDFVQLRASLVSMRHLEMDCRVDFAWFRNRQVSSGGSFAEVDNFCTTQTMNLLKEIISGKNVTLEMYQTGLETAVVGFYRGVVRFLLEQRGKGPILQVLPMYFSGGAGDYEVGKIWA